MFSLKAGQALLLLSALVVTPAFGSRTHRAPTSGHSRVTASKRGKKVARVRGQRTIDSSRAVEIQNALIRQNYLKGAPTGQWDSQTQVAMQKYQSDHGWQTRLMPDSRALISLGLGPNHAAAPAIAHTVSPVSVPDPTAQAQSTEPGENTLASVHSLSQ
jgi:peptidoglycan hydrolase-like protein with peptidoglycan-binding domain